MTSFNYRHMAFIAFALAGFILSGSITWSSVLSDQSIVKECCDHETDASTNQAHESEDSCVNCGCFNCASLIHFCFPFVVGVGRLSVDQLHWVIKGKHPSDYIYSIEYPPETA